MISDKLDVEIGSRSYKIHRTFSDDPAIYGYDGDRFVHIDDIGKKDAPASNILSLVAGLTKGDVVIIAQDNGQSFDKGSKYYEDIGRDLTILVKLFHVKSGEIDEFPLWYAVSLMHIDHQILKYNAFEYMTIDTYPMYNIRNRYIGYIDEEGKFQDKKCFKDMILDFIENLIKMR